MPLHCAELKPYAEPVSASILLPHETYFMLTYLDVDMLVPEMKTLVFLGRDIEGAGSASLSFQDIESYAMVSAHPNHSHGGGDLYTCAEDQLHNIFTLDKAIDELKRCALRRGSAFGRAFEFLGA